MVRAMSLKSSKTAIAVSVAFILVSVSTAMAASDTANGGKIFTSKCAICHTDTKGGPNKIGPNLFGVVGRKAGSIKDFSYSTAMKNSGIVWNENKLKAYLAGPQKVVPGNHMAFAGLSDSKQVGNLVAYLATLK
jgi:cytochrome c